MMKMLLVCIAALLLVQDTLEVCVGLGESGIINILDSLPDACVTLGFGGVETSIGANVSPCDTIECPCFKYDDQKPGRLYTVLMVDADAPSAGNPIWRSFLLYLTVNIEATSYTNNIDLSTGCEIATYLPISPPPGTGPHRIFVVLCKQKKAINTSSKSLNAFQNDRIGFSVADFIEYYDLTVVAATYIVVETNCPC